MSLRAKLFSSFLLAATLIAGQKLTLTPTYVPPFPIHISSPSPFPMLTLTPPSRPPLTTTTTITTTIEVPSCTPVICPTPTYTGPCLPNLQERTAAAPPVVTVTEIETVTWTRSCPGPGGCGAATPTPTPTACK